MGLIRAGGIQAGALLRQASEVFAALGENPGVRKITGASPQELSNWRRQGKFPPTRFLQFDVALRRRRLRADPALWRMRKPIGGRQ
jgi:hypothetical protein